MDIIKRAIHADNGVVNASFLAGLDVRSNLPAPGEGVAGGDGFVLVPLVGNGKREALECKGVSLGKVGRIELALPALHEEVIGFNHDVGMKNFLRMRRLPRAGDASDDVYFHSLVCVGCWNQRGKGRQTISTLPAKHRFR